MRRSLTISAVAALLLIALIAFILLRDDDGITRNTFEDGSVLILRKVSYGKNHRMTGGTWWQRVAGPFVPAAMAKKWKIPVAISTNTDPVLMVWVEHRTDASTNRGTTFYPGLALQDDSGTEFRHHKPAMAATPNGQLIGVPFPAVPHLGPQLSFRLALVYASRFDRSYATTVKFVNPLFDETLRLTTTHTPPVSVTQSNVKVTLSTLRRWRTVGSGYGDGREGRRTTLLRCQLNDLEDSDRKWNISRVSVIGYRGGLYQLSSGRRLTNREEYEIDATLATNQVWNLQLVLSCSRPGSNDLVTVSAIPVPGFFGADLFRPVRTHVKSGTILVRGFVAPATVSASAETPGSDHFLVLAGATSSEGHWVPVLSTDFDHGSNTSRLTITPDVTHVDLTYALTRKIHVNLTVRPER
jgi:hypothetical protein